MKALLGAIAFVVIVFALLLGGLYLKAYYLGNTERGDR